METLDAVKRLAALAQDARLEVFRLLVKAGPEGLAAGDIARHLKTAANTTSAQLLILSNAGLIKARRDGRSIIYSVQFEAMRDLLLFLMEDCCRNSPAINAPIVAVANKASCRSQPRKGEHHETTSRSPRGR